MGDEDRKWEDLEMDCLVNVLGRVGMKSLLLDVPFVCKSWHKASLNPSCWESLVFPELDRFNLHPYTSDSIFDRFKEVYQIDDLCVTAFIKFIIKRSCRKATKLFLPDGCTMEAFKYAADECPALRFLRVHPRILREKTMNFTDALGKWKDLEVLILDNFFGWVEIREEHALAIVTLLPKIKHLYLRSARIDRENLVAIIKGCRELVKLDVSYCTGFEVDQEVLKLTSHIPTFKFEGTTLFDSYPEGYAQGYALGDEYIVGVMKLDYGAIDFHPDYVYDGFGQ